MTDALKTDPPAEKPFSGLTTQTQLGRNMIAVSFVGLVAALDYTASLMSLQPMYSVLQGDQQLFGLAMGVYDLAMILVAPIMALYVDRTGDFFTVFMVSMMLSIAGNALYGSCIYLGFATATGPDAWKIVILSRAIMGAGSVNILAGATFITKTTTFSERIGVLGTYQQFQTLGRMVGPTVGFIFLGLPFPTPKSNSGTLIFSFYTANGWLMTFLSVVGLVLVATLFKNAHSDSVVKDDRPPYDFRLADKGPGSLFRKMIMNGAVVLLTSFVSFSIVSQLFAFGAAQFKVVGNQYDLWKPFVGLGAGAGGGAVIWRRIAKKLRKTHPTQERGWAAFGMLIAAMMPWFFILYAPQPAASPDALLYIGSVLLGAGQVMSLGNLEVIFSKQLTQHRDEVGSSTALLFALYAITVASARFSGPFISGFAIEMADYATGGGKPCLDASGMFNVNSTCCFTTQGFETSTCEVLNVDIYVPILCAITMFAVVLGTYFLRNVVDYTGDTGVEESVEASGDRA